MSLIANKFRIRAAVATEEKNNMEEPVDSVFTGGFEEFVIQVEAEESPALLFLPACNNVALKHERKAPACYSIPKRLQLTCIAANNTYTIRRIYSVGVFDKTTASPLMHEVEGLYG
jgi:hypothetical protein